MWDICEICCICIVTIKQIAYLGEDRESLRSVTDWKKNVRNGMDFSSNRFVAKIFSSGFHLVTPLPLFKKMCNSIWRMNVRRSLNNICSHYVTLSHCAILWNLLTISKPTCRYNDCNLVHWTDYNWTRVSQIKEIWTDGVEKHEADDYI